MANKFVLYADEVKPFGDGKTYDSRMILDNALAGDETVQINQGTVYPGCTAGGGAHEHNEVYYIASGTGTLMLDGETYPARPGALMFIPGGSAHAITNTSETELLILLTFWMKAEWNEMYVKRVQEWGTAYKRADEQ